jgi:hypothetical protein
MRRFRQGRANDVGDIRVEVVDPLAEVPLSPGVKDPMHDLHVLLRHRLLPQPGGFEARFLSR